MWKLLRPPGGGSSARTLYAATPLQAILGRPRSPPPKKFLRALMIRITLKRSNFILLSEFTKNIMNIILDGQKSGFHLR